MNTTGITAGRGLEALRAAIAGRVFVPGEAGYDQARRAWNLAVDQRPDVVVEAGSAADVARAIRMPWARANRTAWATSAADPASTTTAGRWSTARFHARRAWS